MYAPFPSVHNLFGFLFQSVFHLALSLAYSLRMHMFGHLVPAGLYNTRGGERAWRLVNNEKVDKFGLKFYTQM